MTGLLSAKIGSLRSCRPFPHLLRAGLVLIDAEGVAFGQIGCEILEVAYAPAECDLAVIHIYFLLYHGIRIGCDIIGLDQFHLHIVQPGLLQGPDRSAYSYASAGGKRDLDAVLLPLRIAQRDAFRNRNRLDFRSLDIEGIAFNRDGCREGGHINLVISRRSCSSKAYLYLVGITFYTLDRRSYEESRSAAPAKADNAAQGGRIAQFAHISKPAYERSRCIVSACSGLQATVGMQEHIKVVRHRRSHLVVGRLVGSAEGGGIIRQRDTGKLAERISSSPHQFVEILAEHHVSHFRGRAHHEIGLGGQSGVFIHGLGAGTDGYLYPVVGRGRESGEHVSGIAASEGRGIGSSSPFPHLLRTGLVPVNAEGVALRQIGGQVLVFGYAPGQSHLRVVDENEMLEKGCGLYLHAFGPLRFGFAHLRLDAHLVFDILFERSNGRLGICDEMREVGPVGGSCLAELDGVGGCLGNGVPGNKGAAHGRHGRSDDRLCEDHLGFAVFQKFHADIVQDETHLPGISGRTVSAETDSRTCREVLYLDRIALVFISGFDIECRCNVGASVGNRHHVVGGAERGVGNDFNLEILPVAYVGRHCVETEFDRTDLRHVGDGRRHDFPDKIVGSEQYLSSLGAYLELVAVFADLSPVRKPGGRDQFLDCGEQHHGSAGRDGIETVLGVYLHFPGSPGLGEGGDIDALHCIVAVCNRPRLAAPEQFVEVLIEEDVAGLGGSRADLNHLRLRGACLEQRTLEGGDRILHLDPIVLSAFQSRKDEGREGNVGGAGEVVPFEERPVKAPRHIQVGAGFILVERDVITAPDILCEFLESGHGPLDGNRSGRSSQKAYFRLDGGSYAALNGAAPDFDHRGEPGVIHYIYPVGRSLAEIGTDTYIVSLELREIEENAGVIPAGSIGHYSLGDLAVGNLFVLVLHQLDGIGGRAVAICVFAVPDDRQRFRGRCRCIVTQVCRRHDLAFSNVGLHLFGAAARNRKQDGECICQNLFHTQNVLSHACISEGKFDQLTVVCPPVS